MLSIWAVNFADRKMFLENVLETPQRNMPQVSHGGGTVSELRGTFHPMKCESPEATEEVLVGPSNSQHWPGAFLVSSQALGIPEGPNPGFSILLKKWQR